MEDVISRIISDLEGIHNLNPQTPISEQTLLDLQTIVDHQTLNDDGDPDQISPLWEELSSRNLSLSSIISPITSAMESGSIPLSLLSSKVYLSLILSPNSPTLGLFTPMAFNSLLRAIRRAFKDGRGPYTSSDDRRRGFGSSHRRGKGKRSLNSDEEESEREKNELDVRLLFNVLDRLGLVMGLLHLERFPDSLKSLVQTVAEIPVLGSELCGNSGNYKKLSDLCMRVLDEVLSNEYGDTAGTAAEVLKFLSPLILMLNSQARTFALGFVIHRMMVMKKNSDAINKAVVNLPRYLLQKAPEKSEARALAVQSIMEIVKAMHFEDQVGFLDYVLKMAQGKAHLRLLAVDLFPLLLVSLREPSGLVLDDKVENSWRWRCLGALIERCSDANAGIRARALLNMAQLVGNLSSGEQGRAMLKKLMALKNGNSNNKQEWGMNDLLRKRCRDEKAAVRKAAILAISKLMTLGGGLDGDILKAVGMACSDSLVSIRKAAISALSEAFRNTADTSVIIEWLHSVPRLITDSEASIQEECENFFLELVLDRVSRAGSVQLLSQPVTHNSNVNRENLDREMAKLCPNGVFDLLKEICNGEVAPWVKKICRSLVKKNKLKPKIATALQNIISTSESLWLSQSMPIENWTAPRGAWLLLSEVSSFLPKAVNWEFLHHHWKLLDKNGVESEFKIPPQEDRGEGKESMESDSVAWASDRVLLLQTMAKVSVELPPEPAAELAHNLFKRLEKFNMHLTEVNAHVQALKTLCKRKALNPEEADALVTKWVHQILTKALRIIQACLSDEPQFSIENAFVTPTASVSKNGKRAVALSRRLCQATTAVYTIGSLVIICPSIDLKEVIPVLLSIITSGSPELRPNGLPGSTASLKQKAPSLFIQAWLTMGKICLADGKLAKRYIPLFVQELEKSDCAALRNNIIVTMADFCVRYTALVDCYIAKITKCLRDPCELVRRQTFILLSRLLQRDYVKWRGILFLRFLLSLVDESEKIRQLADFLFGNILKAKAPLLAYNSFVEAVFVLNDCHHAHMGHGSLQNSRVENRLFSIRGNDEKSRIEDAPGQAVLQDAFQILTCKEIRIASSRGSSSDSGEVEEESGDGGPASSSAARGRVITQAVKKSLIQNTIPIFIELKRLLESKNSPLIGSLMECLRLLLKDYKNEIDELLVADKQLQKELIYDMQKYETGKARSTATEAVAAVQRSAGYQASGVRMSSSEASAREPSKKLKNDPKVASAMADAAAAAKARSVLREVNQGASTPPLSSIKVPKLKFSRRLASPAAEADARGKIDASIYFNLSGEGILSPTKKTENCLREMFSRLSWRST
ncbi:hypothetical protein Nepgr_010145 [Nepenthes gracilis]|uniref:Condensin complex subunit 1 C-terminal domain-containing protein n=1 Tax=Nepenthes gracilis TaxID=150966 RepID=A0AAD3SCK4_NEPGR|nr:hypothetical protein Nepgr_010145 [Nepenthes gracilis]